MEEPLNIAIAAGAWSHSGGITSFVYHLVQGFDALGADYRIVSAGSACKAWRDELLFSPDDRYLDEADIIFVVHFYPSFKNLDHQRHLLGRIKQSGKPVSVVLFDPVEWRWDGATQVMKWLDPHQIIFVGERNRALYEKVHRSWIPRARLKVFNLPYKRWNDGRNSAKAPRAICTSRIAPEKRIELILQAGVDVELWGGPPHPLSIYYLERFGGDTKNIPGFMGGFEFSREEFDRVYRTASVLVDMTRFEGEGDRVQYTFLEAMDYGLSIVCASDWSGGSEYSDFMPGVHYAPALKPLEIRDAVERLRAGPNPFAEAHEVLLQKHDATKVAGEIIKSWKALIKRK